MKSNFDKCALFGGCILLAASSVLASPLQRSDVAADPAWLIHVDFDNLRSTALGQFALAEMEKPEVQAKFAVFQSLFSFDPRKQLHGVTLYSTGKVPTDGVLLLYADFDSSKLETLAQSAKDHQSTKHNQYVIHSWIDDKRHDRDGSKARTYGAIYGTRLVILAQEESRVTTALDVLDRTAPNLSTSASFADLDYGKGGSFFQAAARKLDVPGSEPHAAMLRLSKFARLQVAEKQHQLTATLNLDANDEETAKQMVSVGRGLISLMKLQKENPEAVKFADALVLRQDGTGLVGSISLPADEIVGFLKAKASKHEQKEEK